MPRLYGVKERINAILYDSLIRTVGNPSSSIAAQTRLFQNPNTNDLSRTNLNSPGQFSSDQTFVAQALRTWMVFQGTNALRLYVQTVSQLHFTIYIGEKPAFHLPASFLPAGGGIMGGGPA